jgi:hypothetical protein
MKRSATALLGILSLFFASCSSTGGPSGGLIGGLTGGLLGLAGDRYIGSQSNTGSTTIQNSNGSTTMIDANGRVSTTPAANTTNNSVNVNGSGTTTGTTSGTTTGTTTGTGTVAGTSSTSGGTIISSSNTGSQAWRDNAGLITGALAGATAGIITDSFRKKDAERRYDEGYAKAKSDSIKELYWLKRDAQKTMKGGDDPPVQYRYYEVEVPAHTTSDGVLIDRHRRVIEVVE